MVRKYASWPPKVVEQTRLGYFEDTNKNWYARDIGASTATSSGHVILQFGDTFCFAGGHDGKKDFKGLAHSSCAVIEHPKTQPTSSHYVNINSDGSVPSLPAYIDGEGDPPVDRHGKPREGWRSTVWCLGGSVFDPVMNDGIAQGFTFFQKSDVNKQEFYEDVKYVGAAAITYETNANVITIERNPAKDAIFIAPEPRYGTYAIFDDGDFVYLYGHSEGKPNECPVHLARVPYSGILSRATSADEALERDVSVISSNGVENLFQRAVSYFKGRQPAAKPKGRYPRGPGQYQFWDGANFQSDVSRSRPVFNNMQHGSIYHSRLFAPNTGRDYICIGCDSRASCAVMIGVAPKPEGPWTFQDLISAPPTKNRDFCGDFTYCMYAHPWAYGEEKGELLVSWSEGGLAGKCIGVQVKFAQE